LGWCRLYTGISGQREVCYRDDNCCKTEPICVGSGSPPHIPVSSSGPSLLCKYHPMRAHGYHTSELKEKRLNMGNFKARIPFWVAPVLTKIHHIRPSPLRKIRPDVFLMHAPDATWRSLVHKTCHGRCILLEVTSSNSGSHRLSHQYWIGMRCRAIGPVK